MPEGRPDRKGFCGRQLIGACSMKKLFQAIRQGELAAVEALLDQKPELIACTAKKPPKKDDGQSPLQIALKTGQLAIAEFLLDRGADVNFIEAPDCCNEWRAPVIHDAINAAIMKSRWNINREEAFGGIEICSTQADADRAFAVLQRMTGMGADVNAADSYGNTCIWRACLQARQILPAYHYQTDTYADDRILTPELTDDLMRIFALLHQCGADFDYIRPGMSMSVRDMYAKEPLAQFLTF